MRGKFYEILVAMYTNVEASIQTKDGLTPKFNCKRGLRQSYNLSPYLFLLYINDIEDRLKSTTARGVFINNKQLYCLLYADDLVIFSENHYSLQLLLNAFHDYCKKNDLIVNSEKNKGNCF